MEDENVSELSKKLDEAISKLDSINNSLQGFRSQRLNENIKTRKHKVKKVIEKF